MNRVLHEIKKNFGSDHKSSLALSVATRQPSSLQSVKHHHQDNQELRFQQQTSSHFRSKGQMKRIYRQLGHAVNKEHIFTT